jgi:hypothetical protein
MRIARVMMFAGLASALLVSASCNRNKGMSVTVPITLDHNRMLVDAEIQKKDGSWRKVRLWVDSGNPDFLVSGACAADLGVVVPADSGNIEIPPPTGVRIGEMTLSFEGVRAKVLNQPRWLFNTMHNDGNLPSTVLQKYDVVFDYPGMQLTIGEPGSIAPRGEPVSASVNRRTGIVQIDAIIGRDSLSFALDNGASYSFASDDVLERISKSVPDCPRSDGAFGCANIWGWWPEEQSWIVLRLPQILCGPVRFTDVGIVSLPGFFGKGISLGEWYSKKTARHVDGFLGPNSYKAFRVQIDYAKSKVYFERGAEVESHDMDLVGLTLRPGVDGSYEVIGIARKEGRAVVEGIAPGDRLLQVGDLPVTGATMGTVVDGLRGKPDEVRRLVLERNGQPFEVVARVVRLL